MHVHTGAPEPVARLYGEPLAEWPTDLYIPPEALHVFLQAFEGPLDLLLYLIRKQHFNILDIPMARLTEQYLGYVAQLQASHLELAGDYLLMAAMLIEIKSRMLLPAKPSPDEAVAEDPRAALVQRLLAYEQTKLGAAALDARPQVGRDVWVAQAQPPEHSPVAWPELTLNDLQLAWQSMLQRAKLVAHHAISREALSVRDHMQRILARLQQHRFVEFADLFDLRHGLPGAVVTFVALLELAKSALIDLTQAQAYVPVYIRLAFTPAPTP